jgi:hypothetical protein
MLCREPRVRAKRVHEPGITSCPLSIEYACSWACQGCNARQRLGATGKPARPHIYIKPLFLPVRVRKPSELRVHLRPFSAPPTQLCFHFCPTLAFSWPSKAVRKAKEDVIDGERRALSQYPRGLLSSLLASQSDGTGSDSFPSYAGHRRVRADRYLGRSNMSGDDRY